MNILTFDIEEWFHILDNESTRTDVHWKNYEVRIHRNMERIFELLARRNQSATFFCLGWIVRKYPEIIRKIDSLGYEIASHSSMHQLIYEQSPKDFKKDLEESMKSIEDCIGKKVTIYRAPGFSIMEKTSWAFEILLENGITTDCSVFPAKLGHGGFSNFGESVPCLMDVNGALLKEFPISRAKLFSRSLFFSGGGYFRLIPYPLISKLAKHSKYMMTYFHPRDFDSEQPVINDLSLCRRFKSYYGLPRAWKKFERLLADFSFVDIKTANTLVDWNQARRIKI